MDQLTQNNQTTFRKLMIFVAGFNLLGWLGWVFAQDGTPASLALGNLIWLISPLFVSILLRLFSKDWKDMGLKPNFKGNGRWYAFSVLVFPVIVAIVLLIGMFFGGTSLINFKTELFIKALGMTFVSTFIKNICEEFAWRGYLTPKVNSIMVKPIWGHLLVGLIWGTWHIPYYLGLLDVTQFEAYTSQPLVVFLPMVILSMMVAGILFGELRLITGSTWPAVLMHTMSNLVIVTLLMDGYVEILDKVVILFTPSWEGLLTMGLIALAGLWLYKLRIQMR